MTTNYYALLNIDNSATHDEIQQAIFREQRIWGNRTNAPSLQRKQEAERVVASLDEAEEVLLVADKRQAYDAELQRSGAGSADKEEVVLSEADKLVEQGWGLLIDGNVADALYVATQATQSSGGDPDAWALLGQAKFRWGDIEDAIYEYRRAIQLRPNDSAFYFDLGAIYETAENYDEAFNQYQRALQIEPGSWMYQAAIGILLLKNGSFDEGISILEKCVAAEPDNETYSTFLALGYSERAYEFWTWVPENNDSNLPPGYYATSKEQVVAAHQLIMKAKNLNVDDAEVTMQVMDVTEKIESMLKRRFHGSILSPIVGGILWAFFFGLGLVLAPLYFYVSRPPQYAINKSHIAGFRSADNEAAGRDIGETIVGLIMTGLVLPIMVIWNYIKYNTGKNSTKDIAIDTADGGTSVITNTELSPAQVKEKLKDHIPEIRAKMETKLDEAGQSIQQYGVERILGEAHGWLPLPIRLIVRKKRFVKFCMNHQDLVFGKQIEA